MPRANRRPVAAKGPIQPRRISRREREAKQRRRLYIGIGLASALVVGILAFSTLNEYVFKPRAVVASVDGVDIRRRDYWKVRSIDLINQINQYQQYAQLVDASQQQQYITLAQQASDDLDDVWGSTDLDETTLNRMVEDQVYLQNMDELGIDVTDADIDAYIDTQFQPSDAPLISPTPSPTFIPQRAEWATQTIEAESQGIDGVFTPTPEPVASPVAGASEASPIGSPADPGTTPATPVVDQIASPVVTDDDVIVDAGPLDAASPVSAASDGSPVAVGPDGSPLASPVAPEETTGVATPNPAQALETAEAGYEAYQDGVFDTAHMSDADYRRLIVRPAVAREKVRAALTADVGQTAEQVHAAHILVDTKDLADTIYADLQLPGANFEQTARDQSNDTSTAPNGGDLGWFARGQMVDPFEQSAFSLPVGLVGEPVQSEFGWHIIKVYERDPNRALSDQQLEQYRDNIVNDWLALRRADMDVSSDIEPSPTPGVSNFVAPPDAPALPTETAAPVASPVIDGSPVPDAGSASEASPSPEAGPIGVATSVPVAASPFASPVIVPVLTASPTVKTTASPPMPASPVASPPAALVASPVASPTA